MTDVALFDVDNPTTGITEQHIRIILRLCFIDMGDSHDELVQKAHTLAQKDPDQAAVLIASHSHAHLTGVDHQASQIREWVEHHLHHPDDLPKPLQVPTLDDCVRLADPGTEAGRALGWLLGIWPDPEKTMNVRAPGPVALGDAGDDDGATWVWLTPHSTEVCVRTDAHPWAEKTVTRVEATPEQMVGVARYMLMNARQEATDE